MSNLLAVKLRRDLRATWARVVMMVVAIAVSLLVFATVLYTWGIVSKETERGYLGTGPASATVLLDRGIDAERMERIAAEARERPGVIEATGRAQFASPVEVNGAARNADLQVFVAAADDPMRMARFQVDQGSWPPAPGELMIGRDTFALLGVAVGDTVSVKTPSGKTARLRVAGSVYDPSLAPAPQEQRGHGYLSAASLAAVGDAAVMDQLKIQVADQPDGTTPSRDRDAIVASAGGIGEWLRGQHGLPIREIQVPAPYEHPHQGQADALLIALLIGGAAALLLSSILVANILNNLFTQQIPQIGIMKAVGARSGVIGRLYLTMTVLIAGTATLIVLVPGIVFSRAWAPSILGFLGIEATSLTAPWWTYAVVLAAGLLLPPLLALVPLVKASRTTVRQSIDHRGLGSNPTAATGLLARLGRIRGLNRGLLMALRNTMRRPARFLLAVGLLASAGILFVAGMSTRSGVEAVAEEGKQARKWDVMVQLANPRPVDELDTILAGAPNISRVEGWAVAQSGVAGPQEVPITRTYPDQGHGSVAVTAIPPDTAMLTVPTLTDGRWLEPGETGAIVLNQVARANTVPDVRAGDTVQLSVGGKPTDWRVVGIAEELGGGSGGAYVTANGLAAATGQPVQANVLRIATDNHDEQTRTAVAGNVEQLLAAAGVDVRSAESVGKAEASTSGHLDPIILILLAISVAMGVVGCIGLASTMTANILERTREFGVMHAIGALPKAVRRIVVAEGVFLAVASLLVAIIPTLALTVLLGSGLGNAFLFAALPFRISGLAVGIWVVLAVLGAILATDAAASRASRLTVREALAYL